MAVLAYHLVLAAYGFWLPNDPRGSGSMFVGSRELYDEAGPATGLLDRSRSVAGAYHDQHARRRAKLALKHAPVKWDGEQARLILHAMAKYLERDAIPIWAAAILPDHLHLVIARSEIRIERLGNWLKGAATRALRDTDLLPTRDVKMFARGYWATYLDSVEAIAAAIRYVERNPVRDGLKHKGGHSSSRSPASDFPRFAASPSERAPCVSATPGSFERPGRFVAESIAMG